LCNSIFQEAIFGSGFSITGLTKCHQEYLFENKLYVDTPGLADATMKLEAAQEIEVALKKNGNYKIIFVITVEDGRIRPQDIETVNAVCGAIHTPFMYGLIINKVEPEIIQMVLSSMSVLLKFFKQQPSLSCVIARDAKIAGRNNVFITNPQTRGELVKFISQLTANTIIAANVQPIDISNYKKEIKKLEKEITHLEQALQETLNRPQPERIVIHETSGSSDNILSTLINAGAFILSRFIP